MDLEVEHVLEIGNLLGEGPVWDSEKSLLFWVDTEGHCFHCMCPATGELRMFDAGVPVYAIGLVAGSDKLVMATSRGFALWNSPAGPLEVIADPEVGRPAARLNDAAVDRQGNFWAGSMGPDFASALYRLGPRRSVQKVESGIGASNGIAWSPDNRTMYFTDTSRRVIFAYDFDASSSTVVNRRV